MKSNWRDRVPEASKARAREYLQRHMNDEPDPEPLPPVEVPSTWPVPRMRVGRHLGKTLYFQFGEEASYDDVFLGHVDSDSWADMLCRAWNFSRMAWQHGEGNAEDCPICKWDPTIPSPFICRVANDGS
jgi:hypothetical protein